MTKGKNMSFNEISPKELDLNLFSAFADRWGLLTGGKEGDFNSMTVSWGAGGILWGEPGCILFVRPQRYTYGFTQKHSAMTLSFYEEKYRKALLMYGTKSGRNTDKTAESGFHPVFCADGVYYEEAEIVIKLEKIYSDMVKKDCFLDMLPLKNYPKEDFHRVYFCRIKGILVKDAQTPDNT